MTEKELQKISDCLSSIEGYCRNKIIPKLRELGYGFDTLSTDWVRKDPYLFPSDHETAKCPETAFWFGISRSGEIKLCQEGHEQGFELNMDKSRPLYGQNSVRLSNSMSQSLELIRRWGSISVKLYEKFVKAQGIEKRIENFDPMKAGDGIRIW